MKDTMKGKQRNSRKLKGAEDLRRARPEKNIFKGKQRNSRKLKDAEVLFRAPSQKKNNK